MAVSSTVRAALFAMGGMALLGFIDNFVKLMAQEIGLWQFHMSRSAIVLAVLVPAAVALGWNIRPKNPLAVFCRGIAGAAGIGLIDPGASGAVCTGAG